MNASHLTSTMGSLNFNKYLLFIYLLKNLPLLRSIIHKILDYLS